MLCAAEVRAAPAVPAHGGAAAALAGRELRGVPVRPLSHHAHQGQRAADQDPEGGGRHSGWTFTGAAPIPPPLSGKAPFTFLRDPWWSRRLL